MFYLKIFNPNNLFLALPGETCTISLTMLLNFCLKLNKSYLHYCFFIKITCVRVCIYVCICVSVQYSHSDAQGEMHENHGQVGLTSLFKKMRICHLLPAEGNRLTQEMRLIADT